MRIESNSIESRISRVGGEVESLLDAAERALEEARALVGEIKEEQARLARAESELAKSTRLARKLVELAQNA